MIYLAPIRFEFLRPYIFFAFLDDEDLINDIHIKAPADLHTLVDDTYATLKESNLPEYKPAFYRVVLANEETGKDTQIGFVAIMREPRPILISFGINIQYRTKPILDRWLKRVKDLFEASNDFPDGAFCVSLYEKNKRAIRFFEKHGFTVNHKQDNFVLLWRS